MASKTTTTTTTDRASELMKSYREAIAEYAVTVGAKRAQVAKRINLLALEISLLDETPDGFEWWTKPSPTVIKSYVHSAEQLSARIVKLRVLAGREDLPEIARSTAHRELTLALDQAAKRGIEVPADE
jgi:hypothetical protein